MSSQKEFLQSPEFDPVKFHRHIVTCSVHLSLFPSKEHFLPPEKPKPTYTTYYFLDLTPSALIYYQNWQKLLNQLDETTPDKNTLLAQISQAQTNFEELAGFSPKDIIIRLQSPEKPESQALITSSVRASTPGEIHSSTILVALSTEASEAYHQYQQSLAQLNQAGYPDQAEIMESLTNSQTSFQTLTSIPPQALLATLRSL